MADPLERLHDEIYAAADSLREGTFGGAVIGLERPPIDYRDALLHRTDLMLTFIRHAFDAGVYFHDYGGAPCHHGFSFAHSRDDLDRILTVMGEAFGAVAGER